MAMARERIDGARGALRAASPSSAATLAYYAMLYAARAALSEEEKNAKTHRGTWDLFRETYIVPRKFDQPLYEEARATQRVREAADYDAKPVARKRAEEIVILAEQFVDAVEELLGGAYSAISSTE
jgi:uncharacterized protein (UPF0332 family)